MKQAAFKPPPIGKTKTVAAEARQRRVGEYAGRIAMKYALVDGQRREAQPRLAGTCPGCGDAMVAKCGNIRVPHWAHRSKRHCDHWWEPETDWHRNWKNQFADDWQEVRQQAEDGEMHIADVKTAHGLVIEFQHSHLAAEERGAREVFYGRMVWVVDGLRLKRDKPRFFKVLNEGVDRCREPLVREVFPDDCALIRKWVDSRVPVFFDFGELDLWYLNPNSGDFCAYLTPARRTDFIETVRSGTHRMGLSGADAVAQPTRVVVQPVQLQRQRWSRRPESFQEYVARNYRARSRRRF